MNQRTIVVGAGVFGLSTADALARRGHAVTVVDPGPIPHPLAASTDVSKVVRLEYGADEMYTALMEEAREAWLSWNRECDSTELGPLYHETGVVMVSREPMSPGGFEYESFATLERRGHTPERVDGAALRRRFPAWSTGRFVDGFVHDKGGFAESGRVVAWLEGRARRRGVEVVLDRVRTIERSNGAVRGVTTEGDARLDADSVVVCAGAWTPALLPKLAKSLRPTGHPVFHLRPENPAAFTADRFPTFTADIAHTGFYGFPLHPAGFVKIANHGAGFGESPDEPGDVPARAEQKLRGFLADTFPDLAEAEVVYRRVCFYTDTQDGDFWIDRDPDVEGLVVASGGSGHGFKFAPLVGGWVADRLEGVSNAALERFRWRPEVRLARSREAARCQEEGSERP